MNILWCLILCHEIWQIFDRRKLFCSVCQKNSKYWKWKRFIKEWTECCWCAHTLLNSAQSRALRLKRSCDPYSILKSLFSCFATKETVAHPSIWKQEQKVMCSGGGCYYTFELQQKREARFVWRILIHTYKSGKICGVRNGCMYVYLPNAHSWSYCAWYCSCSNWLNLPNLHWRHCETVVQVLWKRVLEMKSSSSDLQGLQVSSFIVSDALIVMLAHSRPVASKPLTTGAGSPREFTSSSFLTNDVFVCFIVTQSTHS